MQWEGFGVKLKSFCNIIVQIFTVILQHLQIKLTETYYEGASLLRVK